MRHGRRHRAPRSEEPAQEEAATKATPELRALAREIEAEFIERRSILVDGAAMRVSRSAHPHFLRAAEMAQAFGDTAGEFVHCQLLYLVKKGIPLYPQALGSRKIAAAARVHKADHDAIALARYRAQLERWVHLCSLGPAADILRLHRTEFSPLLCYVMARVLNESETAAECFATARTEFRTYPDAAEIFGGLIKELA